jgi:ribosomal protein S18 acetylase RimI-like enzyme
MDIRIELFEPNRIAEVSGLVAAVMSATPIHVSVFGGKGRAIVRRQERMFELVLRYNPGRSFIAWRGKKLVGFYRMVKWPGCQVQPEQASKIAPILGEILREALPRVQEWVGLWTGEDPPVPHWHLGPVAVAKKYQGRGIGSLMLDHFCAQVDREASAAYLETDREANVRLYSRFGFTLRNTTDLFGVPNFFMWRSPRS